MGTEACAGEQYEVQFFRANEAQPFEKRKATLQHTLYNATYRFGISESGGTSSDEQQQMAAMQKKMMDPNLSSAERDKIMAGYQQMIQTMMKNMTDPSYARKIQEMKQQFGCVSIELSGPANALQGTLQCSEKVGRRLPVTGSFKIAG